MADNRAIPQGYMTVGEIAKKMGVTVRTLQYYDKEGLLSPSAESEGGRRLYTGKDVIKLYQILSLKHLGFSLDAITNRLSAMDSPADVAGALAEQAAAIRERIERLSESLAEIEALKAEVLQMQAVDFNKYADIIVNLQMKNEFYWMIKHLDNGLLDRWRNQFDQESGAVFMETFTRLNNEAFQLQTKGVPPESERGQLFAKAFWELITEFTGGDQATLTKLMKAGALVNPADDEQQKQAAANEFIGAALDAYFTKLGFNPFEEELV